MRAGKSSSPDGGGSRHRQGQGPASRGGRAWIAAGLALALLVVAVPALRVSALISGRTDIAALVAPFGLGLADPDAVASAGLAGEGIVLDLGAIHLEPVDGSAIRLEAGSARLTLPWGRVVFGLDRPVGLLLRDGRIDGDDPSVLARADAGLARLDLRDARWPALDLVGIQALVEPTGALRAEGERLASDGSRARWTLSMAAPGPDGARALTLEGSGGALRRLALTGVVAGGGEAASGRLEAEAGSWRLQGGSWAWRMADGLTAAGTLAGPAGAGALSLALPDPRAGGGNGALLDIAFGRLDLASLGLAQDRFPGGAAILPDFVTLALSLRADLLSFGAEPVGRELMLGGAVMQGRLLVDEAALALPLGGRMAYRRAPRAGADTLDGQLSLDSPAASRELGPYWPEWLPVPPDGAARIAADRLAVGPNGIAVAGLSWAVAGLPEGRVDAAEYRPGETLSLRASLPQVTLAPERIKAALSALAGRTGTLPASLDVDLAVGQARVGEIWATGLTLSALRDGGSAPLRLAARAEDVSGATLELDLRGDPALLALSGTARLTVVDVARWAVLARLVGSPELARLADVSLDLAPAPGGTRLVARAVLSEPAVALGLDAIAAPSDLTIAGDAELAGPDGDALAARFAWSVDGVEITDLRGEWAGVGLDGAARLDCAEDGTDGSVADLTLHLHGDAPAGVLALPLLTGQAIGPSAVDPLLPCTPSVLRGALGAARVVLGPAGVAEGLDVVWAVEDGRLEITRGRFVLAGGVAEFAGAVPLRPGLPPGQAWASLTDVAIDQVIPAELRRELAVAGRLHGDIVLDVPHLAPTGVAAPALDAVLTVLRGEARLTWTDARIAPRLDPDGLGRLANARALAAHLETLFQDGPALEVHLALREGVLSAEGARWNGAVEGAPVALSGTLALMAPMALDLTAQLDRPGFPRPYLRLQAQGTVAAPRLRVDGAWLQPR